MYTDYYYMFREIAFTRYDVAEYAKCCFSDIHFS